MTVTQYILKEIAVCTTTELLKFKREYPKDYDDLIQMAKDSMVLNNIPLTVATN